jgi:hypothetical protein
MLASLATPSAKCFAARKQLPQEEQRSLLKFVTSCSRAPLGGFQHLTPPLTIHKVQGFG